MSANPETLSASDLSEETSWLKPLIENIRKHIKRRNGLTLDFCELPAYAALQLGDERVDSRTHVGFLEPAESSRGGGIGTVVIDGTQYFWNPSIVILASRLPGWEIAFPSKGIPVHIRYESSTGEKRVVCLWWDGQSAPVPISENAENLPPQLASRYQHG